MENEERPLGRFFVSYDEPAYKLKLMEIDPGGRLSNQYHTKRPEAWTIFNGTAIITLDNIVKEYCSGQTILIPQAVKDCIENKGHNKIVIIEVQTGSYFKEDDIFRIQENYNRL